MKIKCYNHGRRVMMLRDKDLPTEVIIHREDGSHCDTETLVLGKRLLLYRTVEPFGVVEVNLKEPIE